MRAVFFYFFAGFAVMLVQRTWIDTSRPQGPSQFLQREVKILNATIFLFFNPRTF